MTKKIESVTAEPLCWPEGWKRTTVAKQRRASFGDTTLFRESRLLFDELRRMGVRDRDAVLSTNLRLRQDGLPYSNQPRVLDPGVSVWFVLKGEERVLACDRYTKVEHNLRAIVKTIEATRGITRWGAVTAEQAFRGFREIPATAGQHVRPWRVVLGLGDRDVMPEDVNMAYKALAALRHPDRGGSHDAMAELNAAREAAMRDLA